VSRDELIEQKAKILFGHLGTYEQPTVDEAWNEMAEWRREVFRQAASASCPPPSGDVIEQALALMFEHELAWYHYPSALGANLGMYRTEYSCICGHKFVTDGHDENEPGRIVRMGRHQMTVLADAGLLAPGGESQ
jgi:hypothetical protein